MAARRIGGASLFPTLAGERGRHAETDEQRPADVALEREIGAVPFEPLPRRACGKGVAPVGDQAEASEEEPEERDLHRHLAAAHLDELGEKSEKEESGLRVEKIDDEA